MIAVVFPGQGSQHIGMCHDFYQQFESVQRLFEEVEDTLKLGLSQAMFYGSESDLKATNYAQPALFTTSVAIVRVLEQEWGVTCQNWRMLAGHSLGEYTALHVAGVISFQDGLVLIKERGKAMATITDGGMVAVIGLSHDILVGMVQELNHDGVWCALANDNSPQQGVISAAIQHLPILAEKAKALGAIKSIILNVSGPFHSTMMRAAQEMFVPFLDIMPFCPPQCPIVTNVSGKDQTNPMILKDHARQQMTHSVLWRGTQMTMAAAGIGHMVEIGSGKVLCGLAKKTIPHVHTYALNTVAALAQWETIGASYSPHPLDVVVGGA